MVKKMVGTRILIVEDERITAEDIKGALESAGYDVPDLVSSGEEAIKKAGEIRPDLILMDIQLDGEMDGIEAAEIIRDKYSIPVIYLTAYSDSFTVQRAKITEPSGYILKEPFGFIHKPFEESELHTTIEITLYRDKVEKRLRDHEQLFQAVLNNVNDAVIVTDSEGRIKFINPVAQDLIGKFEKDEEGKKLVDVFEVLSKEIGQIYGSPDVPISFFDKTIKKSNDEVETHIRGSITLIKDDIGSINGLAIVFRDFK